MQVCYRRRMLQATDDLRHPPAPGEKGRDSLFFNLMLPEEELGVQVYTWVDHTGTAGRQMAVWGPDRKPLALEVDPAVAMGSADFDDWRCAGLEITHPEPLETASVRYQSDKVRLAYDFTAAHEAFSYMENPAGCPQWMARDRFEQAGRAVGELEVDGRVISFDRPAHRDHSWGPRQWGVPHHWKWIVAQTPGGTGVSPGVTGRQLNLMVWVAYGELGLNGYVARDGKTFALVDAQARAEYDDAMTQVRLVATMRDASGQDTELVLDRYALMRLPFGTDSLIFEAACRATIDGEEGSGQFEALWPASYHQLLRRGPGGGSPA